MSLEVESLTVRHSKLCLLSRIQNVRQEVAKLPGSANFVLMCDIIGALMSSVIASNCTTNHQAMVGVKYLLLAWLLIEHETLLLCYGTVIPQA